MNILFKWFKFKQKYIPEPPQKLKPKVKTTDNHPRPYTGNQTYTTPFG